MPATDDTTPEVETVRGPDEVSVFVEDEHLATLSTDTWRALDSELGADAELSQMVAGICADLDGADAPEWMVEALAESD
jgi:hypothetical protein